MNNKPIIETMEGWERWHRKARAEHPARYFFGETIPRLWGRFCHRVSDAKWWVLHRVHPRHRYHVVRTGLGPGYYDTDMRMLHACFNLLVGYVEIECRGVDALRRVLADYERYEHHGHANATREHITLYEWWIERRLRDDDLNPGQQRADREMLHRLVEVRDSMWT